MKINTRQVGGVTVLDLKGDMTIGVGDVAVRNAAQEFMEAGLRNILLNMRDVTMTDSAGIGELVSAYTTVSNRGGKLKLVNLPSKLSDLLQITQLISVFEVFDEEDEAVASF
ncbi:STAS domain-containing protein [Streptomyces sp. NPDC006984]|uniref:STAS domain-containing protein n=1 Tax=Streptomyces sp. NPDC006984 TaxID=3155463 RepID=UPI0033D1C8C6